jgi:predicted ATPase
VAEPSSAPAASARRVVSAAPAADSGLSLAAVLGITQQPGKTVSESVAAALEGRVQLLVFDNCEHVLGAAADLVEAILAQSATVRMIATSREGLGVLDEQLWPVSSLDVARGIDSSAAALFLERARSVVPDLSIAQADEVSVVEICCRLDGIPLAIELAASRMSSMTAIEVRDRLDHRFRLLVGSRRGLERHQTLRQALAWSYDLISDAEKALLARCSVFAGGFDLQSACVVAGSDDLDESPSSIYSTRWCASRCSLPTPQPGGPGSLCWRRSASSPRNSSSLVVKHKRSVVRMPATSWRAKPTSWRCGTVPRSAMHTRGSPRAGQPAHCVSVGRRPG